MVPVRRLGFEPETFSVEVRAVTHAEQNHRGFVVNSSNQMVKHLGVSGKFKFEFSIEVRKKEYFEIIEVSRYNLFLLGASNRIFNLIFSSRSGVD